MKFTKVLLKYFLITMPLCILHNNSYADGFPLRPKTLLLNPSVSYFFANKGWDSLRVKRPFPLNGQFTAITYSLSAEYGISRRWTLVALLPYVSNTFQQTGYKNSSNGLTDLETGIRYYLANIDYKYYIMLQGTVITPLYTDPNLGYGQSGAELKLTFAGSGHLFGQNSYFSIENGVRQYFGSTGPQQDRYSGTFGLTLDSKFKNQVSISLGGFYSTSSFTKFVPNPAVNKNFAFNQVSLSYGHSFSRSFSIFLSGGTFISGRNTGDGSSGSVSFIMKTY
jgi:protein XagA